MSFLRFIRTSKINTNYRVISRHQNKILTYEQLDRDSNALARGLLNRGVKKGDRCAVMLGNNVEFATVRKSLEIRLLERYTNRNRSHMRFLNWVLYWYIHLLAY